MKRLLFAVLIMFQGFNLVASDLSGSANGDDAGIYPLVIAFVMLVSAVIVRLVTLKQNAKSGKRVFQH